MKKGKAAYLTLLRSVLRVPFSKRERTRIAGDAVFLGEGRTGAAVNTVINSGLLKEELAFFRSFNSALAEGIVPDKALLSLTLPLGTREAEVKQIMEAFQRAAERENVAVSGGHTCFSGAVFAPVMTVVISGCFDGAYGRNEAPRALPGQSILLTRFPGDTGAMLLYEGKKEILEKRFSASFLRPVMENRDALSVSKEAEIFRQNHAFMHDVSEGGILGALWEFSEGSGHGFSVDLTAIPMHQETIEITEMLHMDPYTLYSCGCMLAAVSDGEKVLQALLDAGVPAVKIGEVREDAKKLLLHDGEERYLERPVPDPVYELENFG